MKFVKELGRLVSGAAGWVVILSLVFFTCKESIIKTWRPPTSPTTYSDLSAADRTMASLTLLPSRELLLSYVESRDTGEAHWEVAAAYVRASYPPHWFWRVWRMDGPGDSPGLWGLRILPEGVTPLSMELEWRAYGRNEVTAGTREPVFPPRGTTTYETVLMTGDSLRFYGRWLRKVPQEQLDPEYITTLRDALEGRGVPIDSIP